MDEIFRHYHCVERFQDCVISIISVHLIIAWETLHHSCICDQGCPHKLDGSNNANSDVLLNHTQPHADLLPFSPEHCPNHDILAKSDQSTITGKLHCSWIPIIGQMQACKTETFKHAEIHASLALLATASPGYPRQITAPFAKSACRK